MTTINNYRYKFWEASCCAIARDLRLEMALLRPSRLHVLGQQRICGGGVDLLYKMETREKNNLLLPHRCFRASWELPWWADLWLEREFLFDIFQHRWGHICETLSRGWGWREVGRTKTEERSESTSSKTIFPKTTHSWWWAMKRWVNQIMQCGGTVSEASRKTNRTKPAGTH